jgi:hypothetical protein
MPDEPRFIFFHVPPLGYAREESVSVYTDGIHLVADSLEELHAFAKGLCFPESWFQNKKREHPHYDLTTSRAVARAIWYGAIRISSKELLTIMRRPEGRKP